MTATDPAEAALLAAILETPEDDVPRGVLADWWEENAGEVECHDCKGLGHTTHDSADSGKFRSFKYRLDCSQCSGSGRVSDGRRERSEFVRVQVELASFRGGQGECLVCREPLTSPQAVGLACEDCRHNLDALRERERELWPEVGQQVVDFKLHQLLFGGDATVAEPTTVYNANAAYVVRRGFVERVSATLDALLPPCGRCEDGIEANTGRGIGGQWVARECRQCSGTGRDPGVLRALFGAQPVTDVTVVGDGAEEWPSARCVAYGRSVAGLPALT